MQLNKRKPVAVSLALATSALLNQTAAAAEDWQVDTGLLIYSESDSRVSATEPVISVTRNFADESSVSARLTLDSLSGASPNGAAVAGIPQTFTSASGIARLQKAEDDDDDDEIEEYGDRAYYVTQAGDTPYDENFEDNRTTLSLSWLRPLENGFKLNLGGAYSTEGDFTSYSINSALSKDLAQNNTTLSLGVNLEFDEVAPDSGIPRPLTSIIAADTASNTDTKQVTDLVFGITQVMTRRWVTQLNLSLSQSSGHHDDPYKFLTVADQGNLIEDPNDNGLDGVTTYLYLYEHRPEDRQKISLYLQNKVAVFSNDAVDISYRYMTDDWGIDSNTFDLTYHLDVAGQFYLEPHFRYYEQTAADFYTPFLELGTDVSMSGTEINALVDYASADPRLGAFSATTYGMKVGVPLFRSHELSLSYEAYQQQDKNSYRETAAGSDLDGQDQFAELSANWIQVGYSFRW